MFLLTSFPTAVPLQRVPSTLGKVNCTCLHVGGVKLWASTTLWEGQRHGLVELSGDGTIVFLDGARQLEPIGERHTPVFVRVWCLEEYTHGGEDN